jgi:hypothetical protein
MVLVRAFQDKGITCFDGLDSTLERQQRAECFLTILGENNNLLDQLLDIFREEGMTHVLARLNSCRNAYSAINNLFIVLIFDFFIINKHKKCNIHVWHRRCNI